MPLSTEDSAENVGLIPDHLAYTIEGSKFWNDQSEAFKSAYAGCKHYRFITGWNCIDVISMFAPSFAIADSQV
ncbi:hypothetical protein HB780_22565 [Rhizobium lusitanum]|nr:hypothetical protein HB780_22565 [Rhizobium lusitanum]